MIAAVVLLGWGAVAPGGGLAAGLPRTVERAVEPFRWYPLAAGRSWAYQVGEATLTVRVAGADADSTTLETVVGDKVVATERLRVRSDGLVRTHINGQEVTPPIRFLAFEDGRPPADGTEWEVDSQVGGQRTAGRFTVSREKVSVPAGEYEAVVVRSPAVDVAGTPTALTYWFARDVGMVKLEYTIGGTTATLALTAVGK